MALGFEIGDIAIGHYRWNPFGHALLAVQFQNEGEIWDGQHTQAFDLLHITNDGVEVCGASMEAGGGHYNVYRCKGGLDKEHMAKLQTVAYAMLGRKGDPKIEYGGARVLFKGALWRDNGYTAETNERLVKYKNRLHGGQRPLMKHAFCSEIPMVAHQLAAEVVSTSPAWIPRDGMYTLPYALEDWLKQNWDFVGKEDGS